MAEYQLELLIPTLGAEHMAISKLIIGIWGWRDFYMNIEPLTFAGGSCWWYQRFGILFCILVRLWLFRIEWGEHLYPVSHCVLGLTPAASPTQFCFLMLSAICHQPKTTVPDPWEDFLVPVLVRFCTNLNPLNFVCWFVCSRLPSSYN